jgi:hypothetical protein
MPVPFDDKKKADEMPLFEMLSADETESNYRAS